MVLTLDLLRDEDWNLSLMNLMFDAMNNSSTFVNAVYPKHGTKEGREQALQRFLTFKAVDPSQRWIKVTDTEIDQVIGVA